MSFFPEKDSFVIYDTEFTSWPGFMAQGFMSPGRYPEIIQIGAVRIDASDGFTERDFLDILVMPRFNPDLSDYIVELTGISQARLDADGVSFETALSAFLGFLGDESTPLYAFGADGKIMKKNCALNKLPVPALFDREVNLKARMAEAGLIDNTVMSSELPALVGLPPETGGHDALTDVRAVVRALGRLRAQGHAI